MNMSSMELTLLQDTVVRCLLGKIVTITVLVIVVFRLTEMKSGLQSPRTCRWQQEAMCAWSSSHQAVMHCVASAVVASFRAPDF